MTKFRRVWTVSIYECCSHFPQKKAEIFQISRRKQKSSRSAEESRNLPDQQKKAEIF
jgi:hypothetical protein